MMVRGDGALRLSLAAGGHGSLRGRRMTDFMGRRDGERLRLAVGVRAASKLTSSQPVSPTDLAAGIIELSLSLKFC